MALADGCHIAAAVDLVVVVLVDDGDDLLLRQVVDITLAAHIQRRGLRGRDTVDGEVLLIVRQIAIARVGYFIYIGILRRDNGSNRHSLTITIRVGVVALDALHLMVGRNRIGLAAVVEFLTLVFCYKRDTCNIVLFRKRHTGVGIAADRLTDGIGRATNLEGGVHDIVGAGIRHRNGRVVALLVGKALEDFA